MIRQAGILVVVLVVALVALTALAWLLHRQLIYSRTVADHNDAELLDGEEVMVAVGRFLARALR